MPNFLLMCPPLAAAKGVFLPKIFFYFSDCLINGLICARECHMILSTFADDCVHKVLVKC